MSYFNFFTTRNFVDQPKDIHSLFAEKMPRGYRINNTPPIDLGGGEWFSYIRFVAPSREEARECLEGLGFVIVGETWAEVFNGLERRDKVFMVNVNREVDGQLVSHQIPVAQMRPEELPRDGVIRSPTVYSGDAAPTFPFELSENSQKSVEALANFKKSISEDNALSDGQKNQINRYIEAIEAILQQTDVDKGILAQLAQRLKDYALEIMEQVGKRWAVEQLLEWIDLLLNLL